MRVHQPLRRSRPQHRLSSGRQYANWASVVGSWKRFGSIMSGSWQPTNFQLQLSRERECLSTMVSPSAGDRDGEDILWWCFFGNHQDRAVKISIAHNPQSWYSRRSSSSAGEISADGGCSRVCHTSEADRDVCVCCRSCELPALPGWTLGQAPWKVMTVSWSLHSSSTA